MNLCEPIVFNKSYDSGVLPDEWKKGQITNLFKKGDENEPAN